MAERTTGNCNYGMIPITLIIAIHTIGGWDLVQIRVGGNCCARRQGKVELILIKLVIVV